ncbi:hypothetical protein RI056_09455 [Komagataeibacter nataicola]|uniref:hypothetical protein n=1 Tax=Komagataeibacter nataicola TaxID=265960 RepID=UPI0028A817EB|nr:hypothetical protein [Komagataeibacter nataicola]WNM07373.1 hypothetical protein RI056_09455 [Komagataeibacter nataicola]
MPPEIIMVVQNQNPRRRPEAPTVETGRRKPAQPSAHHNKVIGFTGRDGSRISRAITAAMRSLERTWMGAAHALAQGG